MITYRRLGDGVVRSLRIVLLISACSIAAGCNATTSNLTPISDPTQRFEFEGFSILPPRAKGWNRWIWVEQQQPKVVPNVPERALVAVRAYFIKRLSEEITSASDVHRLTAVVRTLNVEDLKVEESIGFLKGMAEGFSGETFLDKCFEQDCMRYQSTSEASNPNFPDSVFVISKHGFFVLHPASPTLVINVEYRQYYARGVQPLSAEALEREVEPFQNSLEFTSTPPIAQAPKSDGLIFHFNRGITYLQKSELNKAISDFNKALEINPYRAEVYYNRGLAYDGKKQYDQAISDYTKAIEIDPKYVYAYNNRGNAYRTKGQYDQAISDYTKAIEIDPRHAKVYNNRGFAYLNKGQYDQAISDHTKALEIDPKYAYAYCYRGIAYGKGKGQYDQAIADFSKAIEINPRFTWAYNNRGIAYEEKGQFDKACSNWKRACELGSCKHYEWAKREGVCL